MAEAICNQIKITYEIHGKGTPLLLIMGIGGQLIHWPPGFIDTLVDMGFQVITFDNRDVGLSEKLTHFGMPKFQKLYIKQLLGLKVEAPYTLADMAKDTVGLLDHLGIEKAHIAGMSMGGMIAQTVAIHHPQRMHSLTSIMSSPTGIFLSHPRALRMLMMKPPKNREEAMERSVQVFTALGGPAFPLDPLLLRQQAGLGYDRCVHPPGYARQMCAIIASGSRKRDLARVRIPSLIIHGSKDPLVPLYTGKATARAIPGSRLEIIDGMGHSLPPGTWPIVGKLIHRHVSNSRP